MFGSVILVRRRSASTFVRHNPACHHAGRVHKLLSEIRCLLLDTACGPGLVRLEAFWEGNGPQPLDRLQECTLEAKIR